MTRSTTILSTLLVAWASLHTISAQETESQTMKLLTLKRAQLMLEKASSDFDRSLKLKEQDLVSHEDFARTRTAYLQAQVDYQQALINFIGSEARVSVVSAVKFQDAGGKKFVRVTLRYSSKELKELGRLNINAGDLFPPDYMREMKDVFVSLRFDGRIISDPYERIIGSLPIETEKTVTFQLLKDVDDLDVEVFFAGKKETTGVYLQKGISSNIVTIGSAQFSQDADLGSEAIYELSLEKFSGEANVFKLDVQNLPSQVTYEFTDPQRNARLSQIKFAEGVTSMKLALRLFLPKNEDADVVIDKTLEFYALVLDHDQASRLQDLRTRKPDAGPSDIAVLNAGSVKLELIPRGVGRIEIDAVNLYHEIKIGEEVRMDIGIKNAGTRKLNNIRILTDLPLNWRAEVKPDLVPVLEQGKEETVTIRFMQPADPVVGDYEVRIRTDCKADSRKVEADEKTVRIHVTSHANLLGVSLLVLLLTGILICIAVFGVRLTRR